ncbi:MAG: hypothetical protein ABUL66_02130 [Verrucomicrobiota bacterium]
MKETFKKSLCRPLRGVASLIMSEKIELGIRVWTAPDCFDNPLACVLGESEFDAICKFTDAFSYFGIWDKQTVRTAKFWEYQAYSKWYVTGGKVFGPEDGKVMLMPPNW